MSEKNVYLFAGDSLTEGRYGEDYVARVAAALEEGRRGLEGEVVNAGRSGETVAALGRGMASLLARYQPDWVVLAVGCNDVWLPWLSSHSLGWRMWLFWRRLQTGQRPTTDLDQFAAAYRAVVDEARRAGSRVLACTVSPVGERISSPVNRQVARLNGVIKHVAAEQQVPVADVWQAFVEALAAQPQHSAYLPGEWLFAWMDRRRYGQQGADEMAQRRRLHLTFDGIHLNSRGADLWVETVLAALARAEEKEQGDRPALARRLDLACFRQDVLRVCASPGWQARARDVGRLLMGAYETLSSLTGMHPPVDVAVLSAVHWQQSACPGPYPRPRSAWNGESGRVYVPEHYGDGFVRDWHLPQTVAAWTSWPPALAEVAEPARATALADLLAVEELARLFLQVGRVAPSDPALGRLLAAYLVQVVLRAGRGPGAARTAALWNAWGQVLERAGHEEGRIRLQARDLYAEHGDGLVASFAGSQPHDGEQAAAALAAKVTHSSDI